MSAGSFSLAGNVQENTVKFLQPRNSHGMQRYLEMLYNLPSRPQQSVFLSKYPSLCPVKIIKKQLISRPGVAKFFVTITIVVKSSTFFEMLPHLKVEDINNLLPSLIHLLIALPNQLYTHYIISTPEESLNHASARSFHPA